MSRCRTINELTVTTNNLILVLFLGISHHKKFLPGYTTHAVVPEISVSSGTCLEAVSSATYIVRSNFLDHMLTALESTSPEDGVLLPNEIEYLPAISAVDAHENPIKDVRTDPQWWEAKPTRRRIWEGTTVLIIGGAKKSAEDVFLRNGGATLHYLDVTTRPPRHGEDFKKKIKPFLTAATTLYEEVKEVVTESGEWSRPPMVMLYREEVLPAIEEKWEGEEDYMDVFVGMPKS